MGAPYLLANPRTGSEPPATTPQVQTRAGIPAMASVAQSPPSPDANLRWAIVLAAGEGMRLVPLTELLYGERVPKQFAVLAGGRSLLQATIDRLQPVVPAPRVVVVVQAALIQSCVSQSGPKGCCLACAYEQMEEANFSRAVLENAEGIGVVCAPGCGFSAWGSSERVLDSFRGTADLDRLLERIAARSDDAPAGGLPSAQRSFVIEQRRTKKAPSASKDLIHDRRKRERPSQHQQSNRPRRRGRASRLRKMASPRLPSG